MTGEAAPASGAGPGARGGVDVDPRRPRPARGRAARGHPVDAREPRPDHEPLVDQGRGGREPLRFPRGARRRQPHRARSSRSRGSSLDDRTWQFRLRRGVVFHNGEPFNAEAVRFTVAARARTRSRSRPIAPTSPRSSASRCSTSHGQSRDAETVCAAPEPTHRLPDGAAALHRREGQPGPGAPAGRDGAVPVRGAGEGRPLIVEAFDRHWRGAPRIRRIIFKPIPEPFTRAAALRNGEVDLITTMPPNWRASSSGCRASSVHRVPSTWHIYLGLNAFRKPLVRRARAPGAQLRDRRGRHRQERARRQWPAARGAVHAADVRLRRRRSKGYAPDPARARRLLAEAGYPDGLEITLEAPAGRYQGDKEIAEALGGQWQKAGFRPKVQVAEWGAYFKRYLGKQIQDAYLLGLGGPMQDGDELYNLVSSKGRGLYYKNEKVDELFDQGRSDHRSREAAEDLRRSRAAHGRGCHLGLPDAAGGHLRHARSLTWTPRADQWLLFHEAVLE